VGGGGGGGGRSYWGEGKGRLLRGRAKWPGQNLSMEGDPHMEGNSAVGKGDP
jgi:hypothetical protein